MSSNAVKLLRVFEEVSLPWFAHIFSTKPFLCARDFFTPVPQPAVLGRTVVAGYGSLILLHAQRTVFLCRRVVAERKCGLGVTDCDFKAVPAVFPFSVRSAMTAYVHGATH